MRRKLAVMICAALLASMLGACGGSTGASQAPAEEAAEETQTEEAEAAEETAEAEAAPEAAAEEAAAEAEEAPAETEASEVAAAEVIEGDLGREADAFAKGSPLGGAVTASGEAENSEFADVADMDNPQSALGAAPAVESVEGLDGTTGAPLSAMVNVNGAAQELTSFFMDEAEGIMTFANVIGNKEGVMTCFIEIYDFYKSAGFTKEDMLGIDINQVYPNFTSMSCSFYEIYDCGSLFRMYVGVTGLDDPDNVKEVIDNGYLTASGYRYPQVFAAEGMINYCRNQGYYELSDEDIDKLGFFK